MNLLLVSSAWDVHPRWLARSLAAAGDRVTVLALEPVGRGIARRIAEPGFEVAFLGRSSTPVDIERAVAMLRSETRFDLAHFTALDGPLAQVAEALDAAGIPLVLSGAPRLEHTRAVRRLLARFTRVLSGQASALLQAGVDPQRLLQEGPGPSPWARPPPGFDDGLQPILQVYGEVLEERGHRRLPPTERLVAVVLHERGLSQTLAAVRALEAGTRRPDAIVVVDNAGEGGAATFLRAGLPTAQILDVGSAGFAQGANTGLERAMSLGADRVLFLSGEVEVLPDTVFQLIATQQRFPELGVVGPVLREKGAPQRVVSEGMQWSARSGRVAHRAQGEVWRSRPAWELQQVDGLSSLALLIGRGVLDTVGLFNRSGVPGFLALDFCLRARGKGFGVACVPSASALHAPAPVERSPLRRVFEAHAQLRLAQAHAPRAALPALARGAAIVASHAMQAAEKRAPQRARAMLSVARAGFAALRSHAGSVAGS